jgi:hypothetical protein
MESKDGRGIITWHGGNVLNESAMLRGIWNVVMELSNGLVEAIVLLENSISHPNLGESIEELSVEVVSDSSSVLHFANHVLDCIP